MIEIYSYLLALLFSLAVDLTTDDYSNKWLTAFSWKKQEYYISLVALQLFSLMKLFAFGILTQLIDRRMSSDQVLILSLVAVDLLLDTVWLLKKY